MAAVCQYQDCGWTGTSTQVVDARCPRCGQRIVYESAPLVDTTIKTLEQFNRRAAKALQGCSLNQWTTQFVRSIAIDVEHYNKLGESEQRNLLNAVLRYAREIVDRPVVEFAERKAPTLTGVARERGRA